MMETPAGTPAIGEHTPVRGSLGRVLAIASVIAVGSGTIGIGYANLRGEINTLRATIDGHTSDKSMHLSHDYHVAHGQPVGNFDFTIALRDLSDKIEASKPRPIICRNVPGGMKCEPKEPNP